MAKIILTLLLLALVSRAPAAPETVLYDGKATDDAHFTVASWGAGTGEDNTDVFLQGTHSLRVIMLDPYQGAQLSLAAPASLNLADPGLVFQITLRPGLITLHYDPHKPSPNQIPEQTTPDPTANPGENPGDMPGGAPPMDMPVPTPVDIPAPDAPGTDTASRPLIPLVTKLHLSFTLADGRKADILRPIPQLSDPSVGTGWYSISVPLSALKFGAGADTKLKSVTLGADHYGVFYIGRIRIATDTAPLTAGIDGPTSVAPGDPVILHAKADGGLSMLQYNWNFGKGNSGQDGNGPTATTRYQNAGNKTVTLTISDLDGVKKPVTVIQVIHVTPPADAAQPGMPGP